jgi:DegV family protein with EDD domain
MIGLVVDSNSQMPAELGRRFGIDIVPLSVTVDGIEYLEGIDLDADQFYRAWSDGHTPDVSTSQPSPGAFVEVYRSMIARGATEILSIHIADAMSGTLNSARLASQQVEVPVRLVDTGTASFGISCCAWAAAEVVAKGGTIAAAADTAQARAASLRTSFVVGVPQLVDRSGRWGGDGVEDATAEGIPVLAMSGADFSVLATVTGLDAAVDVMVDDALAWSPSGDDGLRIAIGSSDASSRPMSCALNDALVDHDAVADVVQYRIGPSVGAHTGPGTAGLFVF